MDLYSQQYAHLEEAQPKLLVHQYIRICPQHSYLHYTCTGMSPSHRAPPPPCVQRRGTQSSKGWQKATMVAIRLVLGPFRKRQRVGTSEDEQMGPWGRGIRGVVVRVTESQLPPSS